MGLDGHVWQAIGNLFPGNPTYEHIQLTRRHLHRKTNGLEPSNGLSHDETVIAEQKKEVKY